MFLFSKVLIILSIGLDLISAKTTVSQTIGDNLMYAACGHLCDKPDIDAIAPLNVYTDKRFIVVIVRDGICSWLLDINDPKQNRDFGRRHHFKYDVVESLFTIFDNPKSNNKFNLTALFTSGMVGEIWRSVNDVIKKSSSAALPLLGLNYNMQKPIDASFGWQPNSTTRIVKIIQNESYYSYDLNKKRQISGKGSLMKDYSYDYKTLGKINGAFSRGKDIYFFNSKEYYIWKSKNGKSGVLSKKLSITKDFYNCGKVYKRPKKVYQTEPMPWKSTTHMTNVEQEEQKEQEEGKDVKLKSFIPKFVTQVSEAESEEEEQETEESVEEEEEEADKEPEEEKSTTNVSKTEEETNTDEEEYEEESDSPEDNKSPKNNVFTVKSDGESEDYPSSNNMTDSSKDPNSAVDPIFDVNTSENATLVSKESTKSLRKNTESDVEYSDDDSKSYVSRSPIHDPDAGLAKPNRDIKTILSTKLLITLIFASILNNFSYNLPKIFKCIHI